MVAVPISTNLITTLVFYYFYGKLCLALKFNSLKEIQMEVREKTLTLVTYGLPERTLAIVYQCQDDDHFMVDLIFPKPKENQPPALRVTRDQIMPIAEDIELKDIGEKIMPVLHSLAKVAFNQEILLGTVRLASQKVIEAFGIGTL